MGPKRSSKTCYWGATPPGHRPRTRSSAGQNEQSPEVVSEPVPSSSSEALQLTQQTPDVLFHPEECRSGQHSPETADKEMERPSENTEVRSRVV